MARAGVLPIQELEQLLFDRCLPQSCKGHIQPASVDLPLSGEMYRVSALFMPRLGETVRQALESVEHHKHDPKRLMEAGINYLVRVEGKFSLPRNLYGFANPKSSTGRLNLFCRTIADKVAAYDTLSAGFEGEIWVIARPDSFPVIVPEGIALSQMRLFNENTRFSHDEIERLIQRHALIRKPGGEQEDLRSVRLERDGSIYLTLDLEGEVGWVISEPKGAMPAVDLSKRDHDPREFFKPVLVEKHGLKIAPRAFYILSTREWVVVPPELSLELRPVDTRVGEFRAHMAGYIDPGWGWGRKGEGKGQPITLEVITPEPILIRPNQPVGRLRYEQMMEAPRVTYDAGASNYTGQFKAKLSKHFKQP